MRKGFIGSLCHAPVAPLGLGIGQDDRFTYETGVGIRRGKMPRLRGVVVLCIGARCPAYGFSSTVYQGKMPDL